MGKAGRKVTIVAIDSSGLVASVAILTDNEIIAEYTINHKKTHSQTLLPMLDAVVKMAELSMEEIDGIAVAAGPGSFTGLRIGSATAKGLGLALNKPLLSVPTLEGMAYNLFGTEKLICPLMDARRNQVYTGIFRFEKDELKTVLEQRAVPIEEIIGEINKLNQEVIFLGDGVSVYQARIEEETTVPFQIAPAHLSKQRAGSIAALGKLYFEKEAFETAGAHRPVYLRLPQAERERLKGKKE